MRVGDKFWHCKRISEENAEIAQFELPKEITTRFMSITVQPSESVFSELAQYGENVKDYRLIIAQPYSKWKGVFNSGDRLYLDGRIPTDEDLADEYADNANYEVVDAPAYNISIHVICKRRVAE